MRAYRLDIYTGTGDKPAGVRRFTADDHEAAGDRADEVMARRPRDEHGLLYDVTSGSDEYVVTVSGEM